MSSILYFLTVSHKGSATKRNLPQDYKSWAFTEIYKIYGDLQIG